MPELTRSALTKGWLSGLEQPTSQVGNLLIRPWLEGDVDAVVAAYADPAIQRWHVRSMTQAEALEWIGSWSRHWQAETGAGWAITEDGALAGRIGFRSFDLAEAAAEIAYWTVPEVRGRAVASRAAQTLCTWMFDVAGLHRIELRHSTANTASCRVADKAGFSFEGTLRRQGLHQDGWHDMHLHARLATDRPG